MWIVAGLMLAAQASSQDLGALKGAATGGGLDLSSLAPGSAGNAAGVLQFCLSNNYLGGADASSMKDKLIGKVGGQDKADQDTGFVSGAKGVVMGGDGKSTNIADMGGSLESGLTKQACEAVLKNAQSLL
jgi:hypothetical protein